MTRRVLLTGATGFVGSHLLRALVARDAQVMIAKRSTSDVSRIVDLLPRVTALDVDRLDVDGLFDGEGFDAIVHLATAYGRRGESPSDLVQTNVAFPLRLLEHAAWRGRVPFVNTDTFSSRYTAIPAGLEHYALTKRHFRELGAEFARGANVQFVNVQLEHVYGPEDEGSKFVPWLIRSLLADTPRVELTAGDQRRDFVFVDDVVRAYLAVLDNLASLPAPVSHVEVGWGASEPLARLVRLSHELSGSSSVLAFGARPHRRGDPMDSTADPAALARIGWTPEVRLRDGLARTIAAERARADASRHAVAAVSVDGARCPGLETT